MVLLAACSTEGSGAAEATPSDERPAAVNTTASASDGRAAEAIAAYEAFLEATVVAEKEPVKKGKSLPPEGDFERWSYDPARIQTLTYIHSLAAMGAEYKGKAPVSHVRVKGVDLEAEPYPQIVLIDCAVPDPSYRPYDAKSGNKLELTSDSNITDPYESTVEMIRVGKRWGVKSIDVKEEGTCQP
ncbi:hypothetical protein KIH74_35370 [Kineosporia sp. J2-2]|uniref:Lipoprotein n=1 Tax=Kineosporia corallincola TaxID=2835133 RepID=A0ABS5TU21_9ACTN|nr:hypothetical protein [Kineosporia corallincola]MBT0774278.1 hypothetical protein [Kineosporia corallincola]